MKLCPRAAQGQPFVIGLAYWPGGLEEYWGPGSPNTTGLNLCDEATQLELVGVVP